MAPSKRILELDILRGLAIVLVLGRHMGKPPESGVPLANQFLWGWYSCGWAGVDLFFVLSGFLISGLLYREYQRQGAVDVVRFLIRRGFKIYPAFYVFFAIALIVNPYLGGLYPESAIPKGVRMPEKGELFGELIFMQNYLGSMWDHTWSLAVEEHFYLLLPLVFIVFQRVSSESENPFRFVPRLFLIVGAVLYPLRIFMHYGFGVSEANIYSLTHFRIDALLFGVMLSYYYHFEHERLQTYVQSLLPKLAVGGLLILAPLMVPAFDIPLFWINYSYTAAYVGSGALLMCLLFWESKRKGAILQRFRWLSFIGKYSYSIYLWHLASRNWGVIVLRETFGLELGFWGELPIYLSLSILVGVTMSLLVEESFLLVRDRFFPSKSGMVQGQTSQNASG